MKRAVLTVLLLIGITFFGVLSPQVFAQDTPPAAEQPAEETTETAGPVLPPGGGSDFQQIYTGVAASEQGEGASLESTGVDTLQITAGGLAMEILGGLPESDGQGGVVNSTGALEHTGRAIAWMYQTPPADTATFVAFMLKGAGIEIAETAYAQIDGPGLGFSSLTPILSTWVAFRNVAYFFFVIVLLAIGFMIMLRQKISGQTVVTAQQAIPQIIVSLLFVTFSYAIGAILIEVMYLSMFLLLGLFGAAEVESFLNNNFVMLGLRLAGSGSNAAFQTVANFSESLTQNLGDVGQNAINFLGGVTLAVVVAIAMLMNIFRLFIELLKTYVSIILSIVFSPIILMMGAIPGQNVFGKWIKNLVGNLAVFPAVLLILIVYDKMTGGLGAGIDLAPEATIERGGFLPPFLFGRSGAESGLAGAATFGVGFGMILILPELVQQVKKALGATGGIFEQLAGNVGENLKRGWTGGQLIPGVTASDTSKWPLGGLSGKNIMQKAGIGAATAGGAIVPGMLPMGIASAARGGSPFDTAGNYGQAVGRAVADLFGDKEMFARDRKARQEGKANYFTAPSQKTNK